MAATITPIIRDEDVALTGAVWLACTVSGAERVPCTLIAEVFESPGLSQATLDRLVALELLSVTYDWSDVEPFTWAGRHYDPRVGRYAPTQRGIDAVIAFDPHASPLS